MNINRLNSFLSKHVLIKNYYFILNNSTKLVLAS